MYELLTNLITITMKKYLLSSIVLATILSGIALADVPTSSGIDKISELKQKITDIKQQTVNARAKIKAELSSTTENLKNVRQELKSLAEIRINKKLDDQKNKVADVFEKAIQNLKDLISKIESRLSKMVVNNVDVSSSNSLLDNAKNKVTLAETELTNLENLLTQDIPAASTSTKNTERKTILKNIKTQSEKTKSAIKLAHKSIVNVIASLKVGLMKKSESSSKSIEISTTTASTTNNL